MKKIITLVCLVVLITACGSTKFDQLDMQKVVANKLGLASSDEVTISDVEESELPGSFGSKKVTLDAKTGNNKKYACTFNVLAGLTPFDKPTTADMSCEKK